MRIDANNGHDWIDVSVVDNAVKIVFEGRDPTVVTITLRETDDIHLLAAALNDAADKIEESFD